MGPDQLSADAVRHKWPDRAFHWLMALVTLVLLFSAILPIVGIKFDWVPWHWVTGVFLTFLTLFHIVRALTLHGVRTMLPNGDDIRQICARSAEYLPAKYDAYQKAYHWTVAVTVLTLIASGVPMLVKLDTQFWDRNPSILTDIQWGYVYVAHGIASLVLIFLVIVHLYFSLLPEHRNLLTSMLSGHGPLYVRGEDNHR